MGFARPFGNWPSDITEALKRVLFELQRACRCGMSSGFPWARLTLLNSFTWEHALDNASASLEGNTPSPQDANDVWANIQPVGL